MKKYREKNSNEKFNRVVAFIPVRGGSKSIPLKNIKPFCNRPLVYWTIKAAVDCDTIDEVYVSTDDERISEVVNSFQFDKVIVVDRSKESASDHSPTEQVMLEFAQEFDFEHIVLVQATSPLLQTRDLDQGLEKYLKSNADSLVSVVRQKRFLWTEGEDGIASPLNYEPSKRPRRQDWEGFFVENGAFYVTNREGLLNSKCRLSGKMAIYEMEETSYFEIDEMSDWAIAEKLKLQQLIKELVPNWNNINLLISDVDGVLTDAGMYYSSDGQELKKFNTRDGKGIELIRNIGVKVMLLTSENIEIVRRRAEKLKVDYVFMGIKDKKTFLDSFFSENSQFSYATTAYIGDDVNDLECLKSSYFSASPRDGHQDVQRVVNYICHLDGGRGCVRELCDLILHGRQYG